MKTRILALVLILLLLLPMTACAREQYDVLFISGGGNRIFTVRGEDGVVKQLSVKEDGKLLWVEKVTVDESVGKQMGTYGLSVIDLNFDGAHDIMLMKSVSGETVNYLCWLWDAERETYVASAQLSYLSNTKIVPERNVLFGFHHEEQTRGGQVTEWTDAATQYVWKSGDLVPDRRIALTYYAESDSYCLSAKIYNPTTQRFDIDIDGTPDRWFFSASELDEYDLSQLYYFR